MRAKALWGVGAAIAVPVLAYGVTAILARPAPPHPVFKQLSPSPLVVAHRGGAGLWPENTLFAFQNAVEMGVDMLEMDVHATADGVLVVMHDDTVDRTTNGAGKIKQMTLDTITQLDAGYHWTGDGGQTYPFRNQGISVSTLEEIFAALPGVLMTIEIKQTEPPIAQTLCDLLRRHRKTEQVIIGSFHPDALHDFRQICPEVATSAHADEVRSFVYLSALRLANVYSPQTNAFQVPQRSGNTQIVTPRFVRDAHARGLQVHVWTVNEPEEMARLIDMGVDGLITDRPDRLMALLVR